jgi:lipopolysaccharide transport system ATP-binding protein
MNTVTLSDGGCGPNAAVRMGTRLVVAVNFCSTAAFAPILGVTVKNIQGLSILRASNLLVGALDIAQRQSSGTISCIFDNLPLLPGRYTIDLTLGDGFRDLDAVAEAITFEVMPSDVFGTGRLPPPGSAVVFWPASFALTNGHPE